MRRRRAPPRWNISRVLRRSLHAASSLASIVARERAGDRWSIGNRLAREIGLAFQTRDAAWVFRNRRTFSVAASRASAMRSRRFAYRTQIILREAVAMLVLREVSHCLTSPSRRSTGKELLSDSSQSS